MSTTDNNEEGAPPYPPTWVGDPFSGHHRSCGVRVKIRCSCGFFEWSLNQQIIKDKALMPLAGEYVRAILHLPPDVHIVGAKWEAVGDSGIVVLALQAYSSDEFPAPRVAARFHEEWNVKTGQRDVIFDGWEPIS